MILNKFEIIENMGHNRNLQKIWPKSRFPKILTQIQIFGKPWPKSMFSNFIFPKSNFLFFAFDRNRDFRKFQLKSKIFEKIQQNWEFS